VTFKFRINPGCYKSSANKEQKMKNVSLAFCREMLGEKEKDEKLS
jgi:4-hydroxy-3-methylbut-2-en-1-yl diphosphate synthase IspG/GcpE